MIWINVHAALHNNTAVQYRVEAVTAIETVSNPWTLCDAEVKLIVVLDVSSCGIY